MEQPIISVIVPIYNASQFLKKCLDSILAQTYQKFELLLINDGSTDTSLAMASSYAQQDSRILIVNQANLGVSAARNKGISMAKGDYITFIDADDWIDPTYFDSLFEGTKLDDKVDLVCCGYYDYSVYAQKLPINDFSNIDAFGVSTDAFMRALLYGTAGVPWAKLYNTAIIKQNNISFNSAIKMSEDLVFNMQYASHSKIVSIIDKNLYHYNRLNSKSLSSKLDPTYFNSYQLSAELIKKTWIEKGLESYFIQQWCEQRMHNFVVTVSVNIALDSKEKFSNRGQKIKLFLADKLSVHAVSVYEHYKSDLKYFLLKQKSYYNFIIYCLVVQFIVRTKLMLIKR